jgi:ArsR family transcriptional regulator
MDSTTDSPLVAVLSALAEPTRLNAMRILWEGGEHCACALIAQLGATQSRVSRHMQALTRAGLVLARRDGYWVRYRVNPDLAPEVSAVLEVVMRVTPALPVVPVACPA